MDWRTVEAVLVEIARKHGFSLEEDCYSDKVIEIDGSMLTEDVPTLYIGPPLNLTEIAKELAERLGSEV